MRDLLNDLQQKWEVLETEPSNTEAWTAFLEQTRALHERATIFRYKSLERLKAQSISDNEVAIEEPPALAWQTVPSNEGAWENSDAIPEIEVESPLAEEKSDGQTSVAPSAAKAANETLSLAERLSLQPLSAILPSIGINDRVRFAGELFGGSMETLQSACTAAESASDFESAREAVTALAASNTDWEDEEEAPHQFMQLVQRLHL